MSAHRKATKIGQVKLNDNLSAVLFLTDRHGIDVYVALFVDKSEQVLQNYDLVAMSEKGLRTLVWQKYNSIKKLV